MWTLASRCATWMPFNKVICCGGSDGILRFYDTTTPKAVRTATPLTWVYDLMAWQLWAESVSPQIVPQLLCTCSVSADHNTGARNFGSSQRSDHACMLQQNKVAFRDRIKGQQFQGMLGVYIFFGSFVLFSWLRWSRKEAESMILLHNLHQSPPHWSDTVIHDNLQEIAQDIQNACSCKPRGYLPHLQPRLVCRGSGSSGCRSQG